VVVPVAALVLAIPVAASAQSSTRDPDAQIVVNGHLDVPAGQTDSTAVLFNGDADIAGTLTGALVVFNGDVTVSGTVRKDVVVFNGEVSIEQGATVGGDVVSRQTPTIADGANVDGNVRSISGAYNVAEYGWASRFAWWLGYTVSMLVLGLVMLALAPRIDGAITYRAVPRVGASFGFGALIFFLLPIASVLLIATIVGIPLGLFLMLALAFIYSIAYVGGAHAIGRRIVKPPRGRFAAFLIGLGIVRVLALIPVLGGIAWFVTTLYGLGVLFVAMRDRPVDDPALIRPDTGRTIAV
jgi:hypothetical protein